MPGSSEESPDRLLPGSPPDRPRISPMGDVAYDQELRLILSDALVLSEQP